MICGDPNAQSILLGDHFPTTKISLLTTIIFASTGIKYELNTLTTHIVNADSIKT